MFSWQAFHFLRPEWLLLFIPYAVIIYILLRKEQVQLQWQNVIAAHILKYLSVGESEYRWLNPGTMAGLAIILMVLILAGPTAGRQITPLSQDESSLVIVLDASESMTQSDIQPSRLQRGKQKIQDLLALRQGGNTALIVFSGSAHTVLPLSNDQEILINYLQAIKAGIVPDNGKFPEKALANISVFNTNANAPLTVLWIGDGFGSQTRSVFQEYFNNNAHQLLILGVGKTRQQLSSDETLRIIPLEDQALREIASDSGGYYQQSTIDDEDVSTLIGYIERYFVDVDDEHSPWEDQGYYLLFLLLPVFLQWFRKGWTLQWGILICALLFSAAPNNAYAQGEGFLGLWFTPDQQGHWYYATDKPLIAAEHFQDPLWKGVSYYQAEEFKLAAEYFSRVDSEQGLFYLGNALAHSKDYIKAVATYDRLLANNPDNGDAVTNRKSVQDLIDAINLMSESQRQEEDGGGSKELGKDDPQRADGAEFKTFVKNETKQYTAEELLEDTSLHDMWMRNVQPDPANFLASKFMMQNDMAERKARDTVEKRLEGEEP